MSYRVVQSPLWSSQYHVMDETGQRTVAVCMSHADAAGVCTALNWKEQNDLKFVS